MALKPVAKDGDVKATKGSKLLDGAASGTWAAGAVSTTPYPFLTIDGFAVIHEAKCTFTFTGLTSASVSISGTSDVKLTAASTTLQEGSTFVLRDGDKKEDGFGNTLTAQATKHLRSD